MEPLPEYHPNIVVIQYHTIVIVRVDVTGHTGYTGLQDVGGQFFFFVVVSV